MLRSTRMADVLRSHRTPVIWAGAALALAGAGTVSAATVASAATVPPASSHVTAPVADGHGPAWTISPLSRDGAGQLALPSQLGGPASLAAAAAHLSSHHVAHVVHAHRAAGHGRSTRRAGSHRVTRRPAVHRAPTWQAVSWELNRQTNPALARHHIMPLADRLLPVGMAGPQQWMPLSSDQYRNATTIVQRTLANHMGIRSAVVAVATAMQESQLVNVSYGTGNSLGLFQQQWNMGWGTAQQIMNPAYATDAFLGALRTYQAADPSWAAQPLWQAAQGVQKSGFPFAYAKWEAQAAQLAKQIAMRLR